MEIKLPMHPERRPLTEDDQKLTPDVLRYLKDRLAHRPDLYRELKKELAAQWEKK